MCVGPASAPEPAHQRDKKCGEDRQDDERGNQRAMGVTVDGGSVDSVRVGGRDGDEDGEK